jgi:RHS repeat-associated protein
VVSPNVNSVASKFKYNQGTSGKNFQGKEGKYFKVERQEELGLNLDMTKFRMYDYALGRFTSVDPLADASPQESWTPYQYAYNSPIQYNDPYGDCPWCIGAIIGAAVDYGLQVAGNLAEGKDLGDALTDVDGKSIALSAAAGATGVGLLSKIGKVVKTTKTVSKATRLSKNVKQGAKFEKKVEKVISKTDTDVAKQITVKTKSGTKTRLDFVSKSKKTGKTKLTEAKSSQKAKLTKNQKKAFPEIAKDGGTVVGKGKGKFPGGTKIPPTKVDIIRPKN